MDGGTSAMASRKADQSRAIIRGIGNVFADLGLPDGH